MNSKVKLEQAWVCRCPNCNDVIIQLPVAAELSEEEERELRQEFGIETYETGDFLAKPETVFCEYCETEFEVEEDES